MIDVAFDELWQAPFRETPYDLLAKAKAPEEMNYAELGRFIEALERSGENPKKEMVQQALKIAFPFTCFIIVLFGAPLANSTRRGGAARWTVAIGLGLVVAPLVMKMAFEKAEAVGSGWMSVRNSNHFGIAGYHAMMALKDDMKGKK